jgi:hypothetical protein
LRGNLPPHLKHHRHGAAHSNLLQAQIPKTTSVLPLATMKKEHVPKKVSTKQVCVVVFSSAAKIEKTGQINGFQVPISSKRNVKFAIDGHLQRANLLTYINFMEY